MSGIARTAGQFAAYAVGYAIGGPIGGAITNTIFNLLAPQPTPNGGDSSRLNDLMREGAEYGSVIRRFYGTMPCRPDVIDCGVDANGEPAGIEEVVTDKKQKRGTGRSGRNRAATQQAAKEYTYFLTAAFLLGEGPLLVDQIIVEDASGDHVIFDRYKVGAGMPQPGTDAWVQYWREVCAGTRPYAQGNGVRLTPEFSGGELISELSQNVRLYRGTERQKADTTLQAIHGASTCNYRGRAYVMMNHWGPLDGSTTLKFVVHSPINGRREIITHRLREAGIPASRIALNSITGTVHGAAVTAIEPARELCEKIAASTFHDLLFVNGAFRDASRINPTYWTIPYGELGAHVASSGDKYPSKSKKEIKHEKELPTSLTIRFIDPDLNYDENEAVAHRNSATYENPMTIELTIAARLSEMIHLADVTLDEMWSNIGGDKISLLPSWAQIAPGNVLIYPSETDTPRMIRVTNGEIGTKGPIEINGVPYDPGVYNVHRNVTVTPRPRPTVPIYDPPNYYIGELPAMDAETINTLGFYIGTSTPLEKPWGGATFESTGTNGLGVYGFRERAIIGSLLTNYVYTDADLSQINYGTTLRVQLFGFGELKSTTEPLMKAGANLLAINNLLISFVTANPLGNNIYDLTGILPGRYGTDWLRNVVANNSRTMLITDDQGNMAPGYDFIPASMTALRRPATFEVFATLDDEKTSGAKTMAIQGYGLMPPRMSVLKEADGAGGYYVRMFPRTRDWDAVEASWKAGIKPRETDPRRATIILKNGATPVFQRTFSSLELPLEIRFTQAQLTAWFGGTPPTLSGSVFHEGTNLRGHERVFTI